MEGGGAIQFFLVTCSIEKGGGELEHLVNGLYFVIWKREQFSLFLIINKEKMKKIAPSPPFYTI